MCLEWIGVQALIWLALGVIAGSAANAMIDRLPRRESWFGGRSHCDKCGHVLGFLDLVPVVSYLMLGGKCRYCHSPIGRRNLVVEILMGVGFALIFSIQYSVFSLAIFWITVVIAVMDWETMLVSDWMVGLWFILIMFNVQYSMFNIYGMLVGIAVIGGLWLVTKKRGMGEGDIGIAAVMGYWLGWPKIAPALWISFVAGAAYGLWLLVVGRAKMKSQIAFGPWLILGAWVGYMWGERMIKMVFR